MSAINVVPYIDVMLVLLIIFMVTAPMLSQGVHVGAVLQQAPSEPKSTSDESPAGPMMVVVSVDSTGGFRINPDADDNPAQPISPDMLANRIRALVRHHTDPGLQVLVKGERCANYGRVVQSLALLQGVGVENIKLVSNTNSESPESPCGS